MLGKEYGAGFQNLPDVNRSQHRPGIYEVSRCIPGKRIESSIVAPERSNRTWPSLTMTFQQKSRQGIKFVRKRIIQRHYKMRCFYLLTTSEYTSMLHDTPYHYFLRNYIKFRIFDLSQHVYGRQPLHAKHPNESGIPLEENGVQVVTSTPSICQSPGRYE